MIDIGANLTHSSFEKDLNDVLNAAWKIGVNAILITGCSLEDSEKAYGISEKDNRLFFTCGIHPHLAGNHVNFDDSAYRTLLNKPTCVALGECGLDYHRNYSTPQQQQQVFQQQLEIAKDYQLPLFLHQRDSLQDYLAIIKESGVSNNWVTHCFTDNKTALKKLLDRGSYIGVTGWICDTRRNQDLLEALTYIPLDRMLIETDAPYLMPVEVGNKSERNEPQYLLRVVSAISRLIDIPEEVIITETQENTLQLFDKITL